MPEMFGPIWTKFGFEYVYQNLLSDCSSVKTYAATAVFHLEEYSHVLYNDVAVNDGPYIRRWSHKIIIL